MSATLRDVARHAGVSPTTVLRALNSNQEISSRTRKTVEDSVRALGYSYRTKHRAGIGRGMRAGTTSATTLTLLFPDKLRTTTNTILTGELVHGIEPVVRRNDLTLTMSELTEDGTLPHILTSMQVGGLLIRRPVEDIKRVFERQLPDLPIVWLFQPFYWPEVGDVVQPDNVAIGRMAARWLLGRGYNRFVAVRTLSSHVETNSRIQSFREELIASESDCVIVDREASEFGTYRNEFLLEDGGKIGYFLPVGEAGTDILYRLLIESGAKYGENFEIISCNSDIERVHLLDPRLPNIDIQPSVLGQVAVESLLWRMANREAPQRAIFVKPALVPGEE